MTDEVTAKFDFRALTSDLEALSQAVQQRLMIGMVASGAKVIKDEAVRLAPLGTGKRARGHPPPGTLKRSIYHQRLLSESQWPVETWVIGVRKGKKFQTMRRGKQTVNMDAYYAVWVERGHWTRTPKGPGPRALRRAAGIAAGIVKWVAPRPFMRPAFVNKQQAAFAAMQAYYDDNLPAATQACKFLRAA